MFETLKNAWRLPDLRKKILYTLLILFIYRLGSNIPVAGVNAAYVASMVEQYDILGFLNLMSGGSLANFTIFAMGIQPYINASIIMNLLTVAIPRLERMAKEDEDGRKKIANYTRYLTIAISLITAIGITLGLGSGAVISTSLWNYAVIGISLAAGSALVMWLGERITENGVGNGISLIIFVNIVSRLPWQVINIISGVAQGAASFWLIPALLVVAVVLIVGVVFVDTGERRVPIQYAKRVVGRKMYGGQSTHIPMKVNSSGVMPIIFAATIMTLPSMIAQFWPNSGFSVWWQANLGPTTVAYFVIYALMILFFTYFYSTISFNPVEVSKNIQQYGGFIPGIRPGKPTSDYLARISSRLTIFGAIFLAIMATLPSLFSSRMGVTGMFGATSILISVSVALETAKQLESQMLMRHYKGFLG